MELSIVSLNIVKVYIIQYLGDLLISIVHIQREEVLTCTRKLQHAHKVHRQTDKIFMKPVVGYHKEEPETTDWQKECTNHKESKFGLDCRLFTEVQVGVMV